MSLPSPLDCRDVATSDIFRPPWIRDDGFLVVHGLPMDDSRVFLTDGYDVSIDGCLVVLDVSTHTSAPKIFGPVPFLKLIGERKNRLAGLASSKLRSRPSHMTSTIQAEEAPKSKFGYQP